MSKFGIAAIVGLLLVCAAAIVKEDREIDRLRLSETQLLGENRLLEDQLRDYEFKISNSKTYEEGVRDATIRQAGGSYADGYAAAKEVYASSHYADGYHAAIAQFGFCPAKTIVGFENNSEAANVSDNK